MKDLHNIIETDPGSIPNMDRILELFTAIKDRKPIEWRPLDKPNKWTETPQANRNLLHTIIKETECFRIKPGPREWWLVYDGHGRYEDVGDNHSHISSKIIHVREVLPDVSGFEYPPQHP
jgi:hypothetical protein